jgi:anaerobic selenocysteine-containing dehydrogenase
MADLNPKDARKLGLRQGSPITVETAYGSIQLKANLTYTVDEGAVFLYQDYPDADVNSIIGPDHLDPISGFPGYRSVRCAVRKAKAKEEAI